MSAISEVTLVAERPAAAIEPQPPSGSKRGMLRDAQGFVRRNVWTLAAISCAMLIPIFWHRHLAPSDLGSHVYNAWLATLIEKGQAPGLYLAHQWNNVLFDMLLAWLGRLMGWAAAERIAESILVLVFFWGGFALISAASRRAAWYLLPGLAMIAYGWTFQIGFSNYYLSLGLGFWAAALLWRGEGRELLLGVGLLPLVLLAHPFGLVFAMGAAAYARIREALTGFWKALPIACAAGIIAMVRTYLGNHYPAKWASAIPIYVMNGLNGVDQIVLGPPYRYLARAVFLFGAGCVVFDGIERVRKGCWKSLGALAIPVELYAIALLAIASLPDSIKLPAYAGWVGYLLMRFSSMAAVLAICVLGYTAPKKWHLAVFGTAAAIFFALLYHDTGVLSRMQARANQLVSQLPAGSRVTATIWALPDSRFYFISRMVDRACVGRCFSYDNYEPATEQFRVRARAGNAIVGSSPRDVQIMEVGAYIVQPSDLPMYQIGQCNADITILCVGQLHAGQENGLMGFHLGQNGEPMGPGIP